MHIENEHIINYTVWAIFALTILSLFGIILLGIVKIFTDNYFSKYQHEMQHWEKVLEKDKKELLTMDLHIDNLKEVIGFAMALGKQEPNNYAEYLHLCLIIRRYSIDTKLTRAYKTSFFKFRRRFFFSLLANLPCSRQQKLYKNIIKNGSTQDCYSLAVFAFSKSVSSAKEAKTFLKIVSDTALLYSLGQNYLKLLFFNILKQLSYIEQNKIKEWLLATNLNLLIVRSFMEVYKNYETAAPKILNNPLRDNMEINNLKEGTFA